MEPYKDKKFCGDCQKNLDVSEFGWASSSRYRNTYCKPCTAKRSRDYYHKHKGTGRLHQERRRSEHQRKLWDVLVNSGGCSDCSVQDPRVLEFDHVRGEKSKEISIMLQRHMNWNDIEKEIAKCDIVCANCHSIRTFARSNAWRHRFYQEVVYGNGAI